MQTQQSTPLGFATNFAIMTGFISLEHSKPAHKVTRKSKAQERKEIITSIVNKSTKELTAADIKELLSKDFVISVCRETVLDDLNDLAKKRLINKREERPPRQGGSYFLFSSIYFKQTQSINFARQKSVQASVEVWRKAMKGAGVFKNSQLASIFERDAASVNKSMAILISKNLVKRHGCKRPYSFEWVGE